MEIESKSFQVEGPAQVKTWWLDMRWMSHPLGLEVGGVRSEGKRNPVCLGITWENF